MQVRCNQPHQFSYFCIDPRVHQKARAAVPARRAAAPRPAGATRTSASVQPLQRNADPTNKVMQTSAAFEAGSSTAPTARSVITVQCTVRMRCGLRNEHKRHWYLLFIRIGFVFEVEHSATEFGSHKQSLQKSIHIARGT